MWYTFNNKNKYEQIQTTDRAYKLAQQLEESNKKQKEFWGSIMKIKTHQMKINNKK